MKNISLTLCIAAILSISMLGAVSADLKFNPTSLSQPIEQGEQYVFTFTVTNDDAAENFTGITSSFTSFPSSFVTSKLDLTGLPSDGEISFNESVTLFLTVSVPSSQSVGAYTGNLILKGNYTSGEEPFSLPITINVTKAVQTWEDDFCLYDGGDSDNPGDLDVTIDISSVDGFGDDNEWLPMDKVEVEITIENNNDDYDVENIAVEWGLWNADSREWVIDVDDEKDFDLKDGDEETITITFTIDDKLDVDLEDLDDGDDYVLYVRAVGEVDNDNNDDTCASDSENVEIIIERDFVILDEITSPETVSCGSDLDISAEVWNIGEDNQDEVSVKIISQDFGFNEIIEVGDIDAFENQKIDVSIPIPSNAKEGKYFITFEVYDEDNDIYINDYDDQESTFTKSFVVEGSCSDSVTDGETGEAIVSANVNSGGSAGEPLIIDVSIENTGDDRATFLINVASYAEWANDVALSEDTLTLDSGEVGKLTFTFDVKSDTPSGDKSFDVELISGNELVVSQPVSVYIEGKSSTNPFGDKWYLWLIGALNVILVVIIIVVAVRVARK